MKLLNILTISVLTFFCVSTLAAEIYIWTDEKGVKHYSDHPPENAESYDVQTETQTYQHDEEADKQRTETEQKQLQDAIKEENENDEKQQQEAAEAERNRPPTQEEKIAAEKDKLEKKLLGSKNNHWNISDLKEIRSPVSDFTATDWKPCCKTRISISRILKNSKEI